MSAASNETGPGQESGLITHFASPERLSPECVREQASIFKGTPLSEALLNGGLACTMILNAHRQIVGASRNVLALTAAADLDSLIGLRPGEALGCIHADKCQSGCGTSEFCRECGAVRAILSGLTGRRDIQECRMTRVVDGQPHAIDLQVLASPIEFEGERFTVLTIHDISDEKRRRALERIFFHDVINLAGGMEGLLLNLRDSAPPELRDEIELSYSTLREMMEEIIAQRDLTAAEKNELHVNPVKTNSIRLLQQVAGIYRSHPCSKGRLITLSAAVESLDLVTDATLARRVLGNLVKNAAEAAMPGETIQLSCQMREGRVDFSVSNPQVMSSEVRHQIFQRSFTTKGSGRGLGTYSVKLIGEKFLKGRVDFSSREGEGTTFTVALPIALG